MNETKIITFFRDRYGKLYHMQKLHNARTGELLYNSRSCHHNSSEFSNEFYIQHGGRKQPGGRQKEQELQLAATRCPVVKPCIQQ